MSAVEPNRTQPDKPQRPTVARLPFFDSDRAIVAALHAGQSAGGAALYDRHHQYVRRVLTRVLGPDAELHDLVQEVFLVAIDGIDRLEDPDALRPWLAGISVHCARAEIRRRTRSRWFPLFAREDLPELEAPVSTPEVDEAMRATYRILARLSADERIAFALRFIEGMELVEVAEACQISLATTKRRLARARSKFENSARTYPELEVWLDGGAS